MWPDQTSVVIMPLVVMLLFFCDCQLSRLPWLTVMFCFVELPNTQAARSRSRTWARTSPCLGSNFPLPQKCSVGTRFRVVGTHCSGGGSGPSPISETLGVLITPCILRPGPCSLETCSQSCSPASSRRWSHTWSTRTTPPTLGSPGITSKRSLPPSSRPRARRRSFESRQYIECIAADKRPCDSVTVC